MSTDESLKAVLHFGARNNSQPFHFPKYTADLKRSHYSISIGYMLHNNMKQEETSTKSLQIHCTQCGEHDLKLECHHNLRQWVLSPQKEGKLWVAIFQIKPLKRCFTESGAGQLFDESILADPIPSCMQDISVMSMFWTSLEEKSWRISQPWKTPLQSAFPPITPL